MNVRTAALKRDGKCVCVAAVQSLGGASKFAHQLHAEKTPLTLSFCYSTFSAFAFRLQRVVFMLSRLGTLRTISRLIIRI